jgi:hypothetical protein
LSMPITVATLSKALTSTILTQDLGFQSLSGHRSVLFLCSFCDCVVLCDGGSRVRGVLPHNYNYESDNRETVFPINSMLPSSLA